MISKSQNKSFIFFGQSGCFLPVLILTNLFFGWMFMRPLIWLSLEAVLLLLLAINSYILIRKISGLSFRRKDVIDVEGRVEEDRGKLQ